MVGGPACKWRKGQGLFSKMAGATLGLTGIDSVLPGARTDLSRWLRSGGGDRLQAKGGGGLVCGGGGAL
jgi:hypothetical protein